MDIQFYRNRRGDCPVAEYINSLKEEERLMILNDEERLESVTLYELLKPRIVVKLKGVSNLYELRSRCFRILFSIYSEFYLLLSMFRKKSNNTPKNEINKALNFKKDYEKRNNIN